ncbi:MAG: hypothetical protein HFJ60_08220, partial [Clostridia bacterium]|nr:hypothetical protein [Clostridia bacterium]
MCTQEDSKIKVTIDGKENVIQTDIIYVQRPDVIQAIKGYGTEKENPNPGYFIKIKASELAQGKHTIKATLVTKDNKEIESYQETVTIDKNNVHIEYSTYLEGIGWQDYKKDGQTAGTQDRNLKIEAIKISGKNLPENVAIVYQAYIQGKGWQEIKNDNEIAGTEGKDLRVEGIKIEINNTEEYSIMYRTKVQNIGWQEWCYDGETSGTIGNNAQIEAIEIKIDDKYTEIKNSICIDWPKNVIENKKQRIHGWVMTNVKNSRTKVFIDNIEIENIKRIDRQDVLNVIKGYGNEIILNAKPGFETEIDFSKYSLGYHTIKVQIVSEDGKILLEQSNNFKVEKPITIQTGTYGISGLKAKGDSRGSDLKYYRFGDGPNVFFATYAIHGYEDLWDRDGYELVDMAEQLYAHLVNSHDNQIADKWTIYIFPGVNQDGLKYGSTNNGPGRTTLFSQAPGNKGIDLNRCWQVGNNYTIFKDNRNYNGTSGFQAYEAQYLRDFLLSHKSKNGQTMLVDLHGWTQQLIGDPDICSYYEKQFSENDKSAVGRYGDGYLINWARNSLGSNSKPAKTALIELPHQGINGHQSVIANNLPTRYLNATLDLLKNINI